MTLDRCSPLITLQDVTFQFPQQKQILLQQVNLKLATNDLLGVLGPSGTGKTTLLKLMAGLQVPTSGTILFDGKKISRDHREISIEFSKNIGMSFQKGGLLDSFTVGGNIEFALEQLTGMNRSERRTIATTVLDQVGLKGTEDLKIEELSGGMLKRLSLARAIALRPRVLLLDEPTAGLDPVTSLEIVNLIQAYRQQTQAVVVVVTTDISVAFTLSRRLVFLYQGKLLEIGTPEDVRNCDHPAVFQFINGKSEGPLTENNHA